MATRLQSPEAIADGRQAWSSLKSVPSILEIRNQKGGKRNWVMCSRKYELA